MIATTSHRTRLSNNAGWMLLGALLALSPQIAGCSLLEDESTHHSSSESRPVPEAAPEASPTSPSAPKTADKQMGPKQGEAAPAPQKAKADSSSQPSSPAKLSEVASAEEGEPFVKRLVIASAVEKREPIELEDAKINTPVLAFVELKHLGNEEAGIVVTFEHESGKKVGHVKLNVPGESNRYRTWARTRNIKDPGEWTAVVHSASGEELARKSFTVAG